MGIAPRLLVLCGRLLIRHAPEWTATLALTGIVALGLVGCATMTGKRSGHDVDDATITAEVKEKLAEEHLPALAEIEINAVHGIVSLNGTVDSEMERLRAAELARRARGVHKVANNLKVRGKG